MEDFDRKMEALGLRQEEFLRGMEALGLRQERFEREMEALGLRQERFHREMEAPRIAPRAISPGGMETIKQSHQEIAALIARAAVNQERASQILAALA